MRFALLMTIFSLGFVVSIAKAFVPGAPPSAPAHGDGWVMGRDFSNLLANPGVSLTVERRGGRVVFEWTSESAARLGEAFELGLHMQTTKQALERVGPIPEGLLNGVRTAGRQP